jgi:predicted amidophosphoribosyltransferase
MSLPWTCARCNLVTPREAGNDRFCRRCKKELLIEMRAAGYLSVHRATWHKYRGPGACENTYETWHGFD